MYFHVDKGVQHEAGARGTGRSIWGAASAFVCCVDMLEGREGCEVSARHDIGTNDMGCHLQILSSLRRLPVSCP